MGHKQTASRSKVTLGGFFFFFILSPITWVLSDLFGSSCPVVGTALVLVLEMRWDSDAMSWSRHMGELLLLKRLCDGFFSLFSRQESVKCSSAAETRTNSPWSGWDAQKKIKNKKLSATSVVLCRQKFPCLRSFSLYCGDNTERYDTLFSQMISYYSRCFMFWRMLSGTECDEQPEAKTQLIVCTSAALEDCLPMWAVCWRMSQDLP